MKKLNFTIQAIAAEAMLADSISNGILNYIRKELRARRAKAK